MVNELNASASKDGPIPEGAQEPNSLLPCATRRSCVQQSQLRGTDLKREVAQNEGINVNRRFYTNVTLNFIGQGDLPSFFGPGLA